MRLNLGEKLNKLRTLRVIIDREKNLGNFKNSKVAYDTSFNKEGLSRKYLFEMEGHGLKFLDVGARDGKLTYLLGVHKNLEFDKVFYEDNLQRFHQKYDYFGMDLNPTGDTRTLAGDICSSSYLKENANFENQFDFIYSNNVFEHLKRPWVAAENLWKMLKTNGICVTIVPFSQRYHESPGDYFRYTHSGIVSLFEDAAGKNGFAVLASGYDILGRRNNWQGDGEANDIVPVDAWGAWRENWFTVCVLRKLHSS